MEPLVLNGDFENGLPDCTTSPYYGCWRANGANSIAIEETEVHSGNKSVRVYARTYTWHAVQQEIDITKVQQDATYYISCWAKVKSDVDPQFFKL